MMPKISVNMFLPGPACYPERVGGCREGNMSAKRLEIVIGGKVQGVWFRASTREQARRFGLSGWVRNLPDGRVEAVFEGAEARLHQMLAWCHDGPPGARVVRVEARWGAATNEFEGFSVSP